MPSYKEAGPLTARGVRQPQRADDANVSYEQVQRQSEAAASLLKLWGYLDTGEL